MQFDLMPSGNRIPFFHDAVENYQCRCGSRDREESTEGDQREERFMKAWVLHGVGDLRFEEVPKPVPEKGEVLVRVKAVGICGSDIPRIYQNGAYSHPLIPGHEFSGIVTEMGEGTDENWSGQRVGVFPLIPCGSCMLCRKGFYEMCRNYDYIGSRRNGAFAEYVTVPVKNLIRLPDEMTFEEAAMLEPMSVAVHAMRRTGPVERDTVAVCGLGAIGLFTVLFLLDAGVKKLLVIGNKECQREAAMKLGVPGAAYCDSRTQDVTRWIQEQTEGCGADVFFECVGKNETYSLAIANTAPLGNVLLVGNPFSDMKLSREVYWKILRNQLHVTGTWNSSFLHTDEDDWHYVLKRLAEKRIDPAGLITHRLTLEELEQGFHAMRDKKGNYVKIMGVV